MDFSRICVGCGGLLFVLLYNYLKPAPALVCLFCFSYLKRDLCLFIPLKICHPIWNELL